MSRQTEERNFSVIQNTRFSPNWPQEPLVNLIDKQRGISYGIVQPGQHDPNGVPIIRVNNINNRALDLSELRRVAPAISASYRRTILRGGELLLTIVGTVGESIIASDNQAGWNVARAIAVIPVREEISSQWVQVCLRSAPLQGLIRDWCNTTVQPTLNLSDIAKLPIPLPPQKTRIRIVKILGRLDDKIEVNRRINRTLEAMAQALYKHWFVDFGPFQDGEFVESELGLIPRGWRVGTVGELGKNIKRIVEPQNIDPETPYISLADMPKGSISLDSWNSSADSISAKHEMQKGEILFGKLRPYFKKIGVSAIDGICSTDILVVAPKQQEFFGLLLLQLIQQEFIDYTEAVSDGTRMPRVSWQMMARYPTVIPSVQVLQQFNLYIQAWAKLITGNIHENRKLTEIRDYLLPKLLSGEISVEAEIAEV